MNKYKKKSNQIVEKNVSLGNPDQFVKTIVIFKAELGFVRNECENKSCFSEFVD